MDSTKNMNPAEFVKKVLGDDFAEYEERFMALLAANGFVMIQRKEDGSSEVVDASKIFGRSVDMMIIDDIGAEFKTGETVLVSTGSTLTDAELFRHVHFGHLFGAKDHIVMSDGVEGQLAPYRGWPIPITASAPKAKKKLPYYHGKRRF